MSLFDRFKRKVPAKASEGPNRAVLINADPMPIPWLGSERLANPSLDTGTEGRGQWRELQEALIDPKATACLEMRCQVVSDLAWNLVAQPGTTPEAMDLVRRALDGLNLVEDFEELAKASYFGLIPMEVVWGVQKGFLLPKDLASFEPLHLAFDPDARPMVLGSYPEPGTLILHRHGSHFRNPWGLGRGRTVPRWTRVKAAVAYATYRDYPRYAHDRLVIRYPDGCPEPEKNEYIQTAQQVIDSPGVIGPESLTVDPVRLESRFEVGAALMEAADAQIALGILGNTLTTGEGKHGTQALGNVHEGQSQRQESADGRGIEATLNRTLIPWIIMLNLGPDAVPPLFRFQREVKAGVKDRLDAAMKWKAEGLRISEVWIRETFGIPAPQDDEDELVKPEPPAPDPGSPLDLPAPAVPPAKDPARAGKDLPRLAAELAAQGLSLTAEDSLEGMFARWGQGYLDRQGAVSRLAAQVLGEAQEYAHATEGLVGLGRDFPTSAAAWLYAALRAGRHAGAWEADREVASASLNEAPELDWNLTPELALRWLEGKVPMSISQVDGLKDDELKTRAFWMAGVDQLGTLQALQRAMAEALAKGTPFDAFKGAWLQKLQTSGVNEARLKASFDLQMHSAYMGGRLASPQANPAVVNLTYVTAGDESVRPEHAIFDGVTRPKNDPFWATHVPPLGFNCRCRIRAALPGETVTVSTDPRLATPPSTGFGQGAQSFNAWLDTLATQPGASWTPLDPSRPGWDWLAASRPSSPLPAPAKALPEPAATGSLVTDPTGRVVAAPGARSDVLQAIQAPAEIWLTPVATAEGQLGLELNYLLPLGGGQVLRVPVVGGLAGRANAPETLSLDAVSPYRQGVNLK